MNSTFLANTQLFRGISEAEIRAMLRCFSAREAAFQKGETIYRAGDVIRDLGLVESGGVHILAQFYWGDRNLFNYVEPGQVFGGSYAAIPDCPLLCDAVAAEDSKILFFDLRRLMATCQHNCHYHHQLIYNLVEVFARQNLQLSHRMMHTAPKSIRERLLSYLSEQAVRQQSSTFTIPFSRQELADYLGVNRSALSHELGKMRDEGLLRFRKNHFSLQKSDINK